MKLQQISCDIQQVIKDRKQLQEIISRRQELDKRRCLSTPEECR